ncbi:clathrin adaptor, mu subunit, partial [Kipferlia bialata]|eukprot:g9959.t1
MIGSVFILSTTEGAILIERHYEGVIPRDVATDFYEEYKSAIQTKSLPSVIPLSGVYLVPVIENDVLFLGAMWTEGSPLGAATFLRRIISLLARQYVPKVDTATIKKHFLIVHQLLDELCDAGIPLNSEPNVAAVLVPPSAGDKLSVNSSSMDLPTECMTAIPWRPATVSHTRNQIFFDIIEQLEACVNPDGTQVHCELSGVMNVKAWLSDTPDLVVKLQDPTVLDEVSFHPCVRYKVFEEHQYLSFVPPDGQFILASYRASRVVTALPVMLNTSLTHASGDQWTLAVSATYHSK